MDEWINGQRMETYKANHRLSISGISSVSINVKCFNNLSLFIS